MIKHLRKLWISFVLMPLLLGQFNSVVLAQNTVSGQVTDGSTGEPLPGVNVVVKGTTSGTSTDLDGQYELTVPSPQSTLVFSFIGYQTREVPINGRTQIDVGLQLEVISGEELVVVGYGTMERRNLTGSVSSINLEEAENRPMNDIGQAINGKTAGVQVVQHSGNPGESPSIQVRGLKSITAGQVPLVVIDGVPQEDMLDLSVINPQNIESIEILKDASASAIYGSKGSGGVILVTTKEGREGDFTLDVSYKASLQELPRKVPMMNAQEYIKTVKAAAQNGWVYNQGGDPDAPNTVAARGEIKYTWPQEWDDPNVVANWPSTDWQDENYDNAPMHKVNLTGSGGTEKVTYNISANYTSQEGIMDIGNKFNRLYFSGKVQSEVTEWLNAGLNYNTRFTDRDERPEFWVFEMHGIEMPPIFPYWTENGNAGGPLTLPNDSRYPSTTPSIDNYEGHYFGTSVNPAAYLNDEINEESTKNFATLWTELTFWEGLKLRSSYSLSKTFGSRSFFRAVDRNIPGINFGGNMTRDRNTTTHWYLDNVLTFNRTFGDHGLNMTAGFDAEETTFEGFSASSSGFENDLLPFLSTAQEPSSNSDSERTTTYMSYFARANYTLKDKYIIKGSIRYDGSSRFGSEKRWGSFPSAGLGWIMSDEPFMEDVSWINNLKLRASYGLTGNNSFGDYIWIPRLNQGSTAIGGTKQTLFQKGNLPNPNLKWERTGMLNIGFDMSLFDDRINLTADFYQSKTEDLLLNLPVSSLTGFNSLLQNVGTIENQGIELSLSSQNVIGNDFLWETDINFAMDRGKATDLGGEEFVTPAGSNGIDVRVIKDGDRLFQYYGYDYIGTYRDQADIDASASPPLAEPGDAKYRDVNGDGEITSDDRTILGTMMPDFTWNMTNTIRWKGLNLSVLLTSSIGGEKVNLQRRRSMWFHGGRNFLTDLNDAWSPDNRDSYYFKPSVDVSSWNTRGSDYWFESASFLKIQNVTLGYNIPASTLQQLGLGISNLRVYLSGERLYSFDNFSGYDPEQGSGGGNYYAEPSNRHITRGFTHSDYAIPRVYTAGINISL